MTTQATLFDLAEGQRRRDAGIAQVSEGKEGWLERARQLAVRLCYERDEVSTDDLRAAGLQIPPGSHWNVMAGIFKDPRFRFAGYALSERPEAHGRVIRRWRLS